MYVWLEALSMEEWMYRVLQGNDVVYGEVVIQCMLR